MKRNTAFTIVIVFALLASIGLAGQTWVKLGKRTVNFQTDHDTISVGGTTGVFHAIRLKVERHAVHFGDLKIHFADGSIKDVELKSVIQAGHFSRTIDLPGKTRVIKKVEFVYKSTGPGPRPGPHRHRRALRAKARVELWGLR